MDDITFWKRLVVKITYFYHVECSPPGYLVCLVAFFIRIIIIFWDAQNLCTALVHDQYLPSTPPTQTWMIWPHTQTCPSRRRYRTRLLAHRHNNQCDKNNLCCWVAASSFDFQLAVCLINVAKLYDAPKYRTSSCHIEVLYLLALAGITESHFSFPCPCVQSSTIWLIKF